MASAGSLSTTPFPSPFIPLPGAVRPPGATKRQWEADPNPGPLYTPSDPIFTPLIPTTTSAPFLLTETEMEGQALGSGLGPDPGTPWLSAGGVSAHQAGLRPSVPHR